MKLDHWQQHEPILLAFENAWQGNSTPSIDDFLPESIEDERADLLSELVVIDFEHRWRRDPSTKVDRYFQAYPEVLKNATIREELIRHEFRLRQKAGDVPDLSLIHI